MIEIDESSTYWPLRITFGIVPLVAGLDKFFNVLTDWTAYLSPFAAAVIPLEPATFMKVAGIIEAAVGLMVLAGLTAVGARIAAAWLVAIAVNLALAGMLDIAVRDVVMAVSAFVLARLADAHEVATARAAVVSATGSLAKRAA